MHELFIRIYSSKIASLHAHEDESRNELPTNERPLQAAPYLSAYLYGQTTSHSLSAAGAA